MRIADRITGRRRWTNRRGWLNRINGPALEWDNGTKEWYLDGYHTQVETGNIVRFGRSQ